MQSTGTATGSREQQETLPEGDALFAELSESEIWWRDHQSWLEENGYMLRPRYRPGWKPSWEENGKDAMDCEDSVAILRGHLMDATRIADGKMVILKKVFDGTHPYEVDVSRFFSTEPLASHPRNHCVQMYAIMDVPGETRLHILVMSMLREFDDPNFKTVGEAVDFFHQIFEALQFMHQCHVAHRDCMDLNIMMDPSPLYPNMYHPQETLMTMDLKSAAKHYTRTRRPTKYYLIDFGLSKKYNPLDGPPRELPIWGGDKTVPEFQHSNDPCDPFPTDIYYLGNMIRERFLQKFDGVEFMASLVVDMVQADPSKRPAIDEVVARFGEIRRMLSWWKLRSRLLKKGEAGLYKAYQTTRHVFRTIGYFVAFRSSVPSR